MDMNKMVNWREIGVRPDDDIDLINDVRQYFTDEELKVFGNYVPLRNLGDKEVNIYGKGRR
jgi:hypothetical protein